MSLQFVVTRPRGPLGFKQLAKLKLYPDNQHPHQAQQPQELKLKS